MVIMSTHAHRALPYPRPATWHQRIQNAKVRGRFTATEITLAQSWNSCAIGERFHVQAKVDTGAVSTIDGHAGTGAVRFMLSDNHGWETADRLVRLGQSFYHAVLRNEFSNAEYLNRQIRKA